jgi:hypothetical protein
MDKKLERMKSDARLAGAVFSLRDLCLLGVEDVQYANE